MSGVLAAVWLLFAMSVDTLAGALVAAVLTVLVASAAYAEAGEVR